VAVIDNEEDLDVDLVEITDPSNPVLLAETGLPNWPSAETNANGQLSFAHDYDVIQKPDGTWHLMVSYWDTGWVDLDVTDPVNPVFIEDFTYAACDQVVPTACPPEGNAHQGEWNADGSLFIGTDEDFDPYRTTPLVRTTGPGAPETYSTVSVGGAPVTVLPDLRLNGPVAYGGYGCPGASAPIPSADSIFPPGSLDPGEEQIIVLQRGPTGDPNNPEPACFPGEKADNATDQGWDAVILTGRHLAGGAAAAMTRRIADSVHFPQTSRSPQYAPRTQPCTSYSTAQSTSPFPILWVTRVTLSRTSAMLVSRLTSLLSSMAGAMFGCLTPTQPMGSPRLPNSLSHRLPIPFLWGSERHNT
jgi:hypothetical protein